jgi:hypothetical protein
MLYGFIGLILILLALVCVVAVMVVILREKPHDTQGTHYVRSPFPTEPLHSEAHGAASGDVLESVPVVEEKPEHP